MPEACCAFIFLSCLTLFEAGACLSAQLLSKIAFSFLAPKNVWNPLGERRHYVSKGCLDKASCKKMEAMYKNRCTRERYNDWTCVECCEGDGCNYDVYVSAKRTISVLKMGNRVGNLLASALNINVSQHKIFSRNSLQVKPTR